MSSVVLGVIGAVVAPLVGLPPQVGYALGSALGSALFPPPGHNGPRISDLKVQGSQFGSPIPLAYGSVRVTGQLIWADKLVEHPDQTDSGSGGGGSTNYTYTCSFAMSLCERDTLSGKTLGRIWADGKLIYNGGVIPAKVGFTAGSYKFYDGSEAQLPDPTMEALLGVGNVPAYRGQVYFVFTDLELGKYGNRLPNLSFELNAAALTGSLGSITSQILTPIEAAYGPYSGFSVPALMTYVSSTNQIWEVINADPYAPNSVYGAIALIDVTTMTVVGHTTPYTQYDNAIGPTTGPTREAVNGRTLLVYNPVDNNVWSFSQKTVEVYSAAGVWLFGCQYGIQQEFSPGYPVDLGLGGVSPITGQPWLMIQSGEQTLSGKLWKLSRTTAQLGASVTLTGILGFLPTAFAFDKTGNLWLANYGGYGYPNNATPIPAYPLTVFKVENNDTGTLKYSHPFSPTSTNEQIARSMSYNSTSDQMIVALEETPGYRTLLVLGSAGQVIAITKKPNVLYNALGQAGGYLALGAYYDPKLDVVWQSGELKGGVQVLNPTNLAVVGNSDAIEDPLAYYHDLLPILITPVGIFQAANGNGSYFYRRSLVPGVPASTTVSLQSIVTDLSGKVGLEPSQIDVSQLKDNVIGYSVPSRMTARTAIQPLSDAFFFDSVESGQTVKFIKRGGASALAISADQTVHTSKG